MGHGGSESKNIPDTHGKCGGGPEGHRAAAGHFRSSRKARVTGAHQVTRALQPGQRWGRCSECDCHTVEVPRELLAEQGREQTVCFSKLRDSRFQHHGRKGRGLGWGGGRTGRDRIRDGKVC